MRCIGKIEKLIEARMQSEGSRRVVREWKNLNTESHGRH